MRRENVKLRMERDLQTKSRRLFRHGVDVKFGFVPKHRGTWPVDMTCEALGISRSEHYVWLTRSPSVRARADVVVGAAVRARFLVSDRTFGTRRVGRDVRAARHGGTVSRKPCETEKAHDYLVQTIDHWI